MSLYELVWPQSPELHSSVPKEVQEVYSEANAIMARAPNAYANQIRRALETVCKDRGASKSNLAKSIDELRIRGEIPDTLSNMSDILRQIGNMGSHASGESVTPDYVPIIDEFFRAIIEYVYVAPQKVADVKTKLVQMKSSSSGSP